MGQIIIFRQKLQSRYGPGIFHIVLPRVRSRLCKTCACQTISKFEIVLYCSSFQLSTPDQIITLIFNPSFPRWVINNESLPYNIYKGPLFFHFGQHHHVSLLYHLEQLQKTKKIQKDVGQGQGHEILHLIQTKLQIDTLDYRFVLRILDFYKISYSRLKIHKKMKMSFTYSIVMTRRCVKEKLLNLLQEVILISPAKVLVQPRFHTKSMWLLNILLLTIHI